MGCLFGFVAELFVEGIFELIVYCYMKLMQWIVPEKTISEKATNTIKNVVTTFSALLAISLLIGCLFLIQDDPFIKNIGKYMTNIPLAIIAIQVLLGILMKIFRHYKK